MTKIEVSVFRLGLLLYIYRVLGLAGGVVCPLGILV